MQNYFIYAYLKSNVFYIFSLCIYIRAGRYDQKFISRYFLNYTGFTVYDGIYFFMHDQVLTTFSTDWGKTAVDWWWVNIVEKVHTKYRG